MGSGLTFNSNDFNQISTTLVNDDEKKEEEEPVAFMPKSTNSSTNVKKEIVTQKNVVEDRFGGSNGATTNTEEIRELLDEAVDNITRNVHKDVQNLHLELFRQFQIQLSDMKSLLDEYTDKIKGLVEENDRLRKENILLRNVY